ncbi:MAG: acyl-CoA dehydrogenase family protein [bacterium JZ-2024 1]
MNFELSPVQRMIRDLSRQFARDELEPISAAIDESGELPSETIARMGAIGLMGLTIPKQYGGAGLDALSYALAIEEISKASASHGVILSVHLSLVAQPIAKYGTEEQKKRILPELATGTAIGAFSLTEPGSGSDAAALKTTAVKVHGGYILNGTKSWVTSGTEAKYILTYACTKPDAGSRGVTAFIVEPGFEGFRVGRVEPKLGIRASHTCELHFENCFVPETNRLGEEGDGFHIALWALDGGRLGIAAQALGIAEAAYERSVAYAQQREAFGHKISEFQAIQWMLVEMKRRIEIARLFIWNAAIKKDRGERFTLEASMAKLWASETAVWVTTNAIQIHGANGYSKEYPLERYFRDAKVTEIYEGTSEIQRLIIARHILTGN